MWVKFSKIARVRARVAGVVAFFIATPLASAAFITVPNIDPASANDVDQSGAYFSSTGFAGPGNVVDLAGFQTALASSFPLERGGVIDFEVRNDVTATPVGSLDSPTQFTGRYGASGNQVAGYKALQISTDIGTWRWPGFTTFDRTPTSGVNSLGKDGNDIFDFDILIGSITNGELGERVSGFGFTILERSGADVGTPVTVTTTFSDGSTVLSRATIANAAPASDQDSFFGFIAPGALSITSVTFNPGNFTTIDDLVFLTGIPEPGSAIAGIAVCAAPLFRRRRRQPR